MSEKEAADVLILNRNIENEYHSVAVKPTCHVGVAPLLDISNSEMMTEPIIANCPNPTKTNMKRPPSDDEESVEFGNVKKIKLLDQDDVGDDINEKLAAITNDVRNLLDNHIKEEIEDSTSCNGIHVDEDTSKCDANPVEDTTNENVKCKNKSDLNGETTFKTENKETFSNGEKATSIEGTPESSTTEISHADTSSPPDENECTANIEKASICDNSNLNSSVNCTASVHNNIDTNTNSTKTDEPTVPHCDSSSEKDIESKLNSIQPAPRECTDLNNSHAQTLLVSYADSKSSLSNGNINEPTKDDSVCETKDNLQIEEKPTNVDNADVFAERDFDDVECLEPTDKTTESIELADKESDSTDVERLESTDKTTESIELEDKEEDLECLESTDKTTESIELADKTTESIELADKTTESIELADKTTESIELADKTTESIELTDKTTEGIELPDKERDSTDVESTEKISKSIELADTEEDLECLESTDKTTESIELADKTTESIELTDKTTEIIELTDKTTEGIELPDKESDSADVERLESTEKISKSIELGDTEEDLECLESTHKTTESIELRNVSDNIDESAIIPEKKDSHLETDKSDDVMEGSKSDETQSKEDNISVQNESDENQSEKDKISAKSKLDENQKTEVEIYTLDECKTETTNTEEVLNQNEKEVKETTKSEESKINPAHEMEESPVDVPVIIDLDDKTKIENAELNKLKNTEKLHIIEQGEQIIDQETNQSEKCNSGSIEDDGDVDISDEPQVKKIKLNEADSSLIEDNIINDDCDMIESSNNEIVKEDLKVESEDVSMETDDPIPQSEILNSISENIDSSKKNESKEPEKLLNVLTDAIVASGDVQDDVNEPDVKEHDIKTESQEGKTAEEEKSKENGETVKETIVKEDEELVIVKEADKVIDEINTTKVCKTETLPSENSNSVQDSHIKSENTDEAMSENTDAAKECKNETVIIADSLENSNLENNVANDVNQCNSEGESNKAEDSIGQLIKQDLITQKKEDSTDDDVAIVNNSKEIVNLVNTKEKEQKSESANENIANSNMEKDGPLEISETKNVDSDIELIEEDSTKEIDSINVNEKTDDLISAAKDTENNGSIDDPGKQEVDLEKDENKKADDVISATNDTKKNVNIPESGEEGAAIEKVEKTVILNGSNIESDAKPVESLVENDKSEVEINSNAKLTVPTEESVKNISDSQIDGTKNDQNDTDKHKNDIEAALKDIENDIDDDMDCGDNLVIDDIMEDSDVELVEDIVKNKEDAKDISESDKVQNDLVIETNTTVMDVDSPVTNTILPIDNANDKPESNLDNVDKDKAESVVETDKEKTESSLHSILRSHLDTKDVSKENTETSVNKSKDDDDEIIFIKECKKASDCTCVMCDGKKKNNDKDGKEDNSEKEGQKDSGKKKDATVKSKKDVIPKIHEKLENLTKKGMEKLVNTLFAKFFAYESESGKLRELLGKLQAENASIKSVCQAQAKQLKELVHLHEKAVGEIETFKAENKGGLPPMPVKITRSVGLQVKVSPSVEKKRPATASPLTARQASLKRKRGSPAPTSSPRAAAAQQVRSLPSSPLAIPKSTAQSPVYRAATFSTTAARKSTGGVSHRFGQRNPRTMSSPAGGAGGLRILPPRTVNSNAVNAAAARPLLSPRGAPVLGRIITRAPAGSVPRSPTPATITVKQPASSGVETINLDDDTPRASHHQQQKVVRPNNNAIRLTSNTTGTTVRTPGQGAPSRYVPLSQGIKLRPATGSTANILTSVANTSSTTTYILETSAGPIPFQTSNPNVRLNFKPNATANAPVRLQYQGHPAPVPTTPAAVNLPLEARYKMVPAAPKLRVQLADAGKGIQLTWSLDSTPDMASIESYQLYAYQENKAMAISSNLWKNIGKLEALPLPMACTLTQFTAGHTYHFLVRAIDVFKRYSAFSNPGTIHLRT